MSTSILARPLGRPGEGRPLDIEVVRGRPRRSRRRYLVISFQWLPIIVAVQIGLSLRLLWSNTAFSDESLYLWAGRLEWSHWLHGSPLPTFATYFSGAPVIYPPLAALADSIGGLAAARLLSLCFMVGATLLLYSTTGRLFGRRAAACAAAVFVCLGPAQVLSAFATYDAMAIFLIALATWLAVRGRGQTGELLLVAAGLSLALADATKYASALWTPVVVVLVAFTAPQSGWLRPTMRACRLAIYVAAPLIVALFAFGGKTYIRGVMFTTLERQAGGTYASALTVMSDSFNWVGIIFILALIGTVVSFFTAPLRTRCVCATLTAAVLLAPLHQAQIHISTSLHKHVLFGAWFGAIVAGYLLAKASEVNRERGWRVGAVAAGIALFIGIPQTNSLFTYGWPNTSKVMSDLAKVIPQHVCPCLIAEQFPALYYIPHLAPSSVTGPYSFFYRDRTTGRLLDGLPAYEQAIRDHYFAVVEMDPAGNPAIYEPIIKTLATTAGYHLQATVKIQHWGRQYMEIWTSAGPGGS